MSIAADLELIQSQPQAKIWGDEFDDMNRIKSFKGKFVITQKRQFLARLFPRAEWDAAEFYHDMVLEELGVQDAESMAMRFPERGHRWLLFVAGDGSRRRAGR